MMVDQRSTEVPQDAEQVHHVRWNASDGDRLEKAKGSPTDQTVGIMLRRMMPFAIASRTNSQNGRNFPSRAVMLEKLRHHPKASYGAFLRRMEEAES